LLEALEELGGRGTTGDICDIVADKEKSLMAMHNPLGPSRQLSLRSVDETKTPLTR
jgi:hypothetical protein